MTYIDRIKNMSEEEFSKIVKENNSIASMLRSIGAGTRNTRMIKLIGEKIKEYDLDTKHMTRPNLYNLNEVLIENSSYNNQTLKKRIVEEGLISYICDECKNNGEWNGTKLVLQLDHINGKNNDNRLENLRFLCPNCHSQTDTFSGKNIGKYDKVKPFSGIST